MSKFTFRFMVALSLLVLVLAACAPAGSNATPGADATEGVPGTGPDATATTVTGGAGDTGTDNAQCEGVDTAQLITSGQAVYTAQCAGCHGEQGEGQENFPALAGDANLAGADIPAIVQAYLAVDAHPKDLTGEDLAAVLSYSRSTFTDNAAVICPAQIQDLVPAAQ